MLIAHPELMSRTCELCKRWMYEGDDGPKNMGHKRKRNRDGKGFLPRPPGSPTPCWKCPKTAGYETRNASIGREAELSDRNWRTLELYMRLHGAAGQVTWRPDAILEKNLGILHSMFDDNERFERRQLLAMIPSLAAR